MELLRALGALVETPTEDLRPVAEALDLGPLPPAHEHTELFAFQLVPYASIYLGAEGMIGGEARDRIAGFWRALGVEPSAEPDHLALMLASYARLLEGMAEASDPAARERSAHCARAYLDEHLLSWLPVYLRKLAELSGGFYAAWSELLLDTLLEGADAERLDELGGSVHFRLSEGFPELDAGAPAADEILEALLAPVRSGLILTRRDVAAAARDLGLAGRIGERRFMLEAMQRQAGRELLEWLVGFCDRTLSGYASRAERLGPWMSPWRRRLEATRRGLAAAR